MNLDRFEAVTQRYATLRIGVVGDFCLDRYLEIDPAKAEISIETGLPVYNVTRTRSQPGAAGTILNNLAALGVGRLDPTGFAGEDGEGYELVRALGRVSGVRMDSFFQTADRRTFTYCKPLVIEAGRSPRELNRLDSKNWTETPASVSAEIAARVEALAKTVDALILMDQVDLPGTGVITHEVLETVRKVCIARPELLIVADSRRGLQNFPPVTFKMNVAELGRLSGTTPPLSLSDVKRDATALAHRNGRPVVVTMAEAGMIAAAPTGETVHVPALPMRGEIDVVGAGDAVTANVICALAAGATLRESIELANAAASIVIHQLGTTGTATIAQLRETLFQG